MPVSESHCAMSTRKVLHLRETLARRFDCIDGQAVSTMPCSPAWQTELWTKLVPTSISQPIDINLERVTWRGLLPSGNRRSQVVLTAAR